MRIYDEDGSLVLLDDKDIRLGESLLHSYEKYDARVVAEGANSSEYSVSYVLHRGTKAECRDFIALLAEELGPVIRIEVSSTPRPEEPNPARQVENDCPF